MKSEKSWCLSATAFDCAQKQTLLNQLKSQTEQEGFWDDINNATKVNKQITQIENQIKKFQNISDMHAYLTELCKEVVEENNPLFAELTKECDDLIKQTTQFKVELLLNEKYDGNNAIITIQSGAGGTEAQDWVQMLYRMISMYLEKHKLKSEVLNLDYGDDAGIKSITFKAVGDFAYGYLKCEKGVHRLVRISPFDANKRRHTSFASIDVIPEILDVPKVEINDKDLRIDTYCSSGAGGQHVNKTESACRITHLPTGTVVTCQNERSLIQNKEQAMKVLYSKLLVLEEEKEKANMKSIQGQLKKIEWGSQIRSYVFCPYTLVKDHRTGFETSNVSAVMDGEIHDFICDYLIKSKTTKEE